MAPHGCYPCKGGAWSPLQLAGTKMASTGEGNFKDLQSPRFKDLQAETNEDALDEIWFFGRKAGQVECD